MTRLFNPAGEPQVYDTEGHTVDGWGWADTAEGDPVTDALTSAGVLIVSSEQPTPEPTPEPEVAKSSRRTRSQEDTPS